MKFVNVLLALLVSAVIALLVFEGGLRLIGFGPPRTINEFDETLGWSKRPNERLHKKSSEYDITIETNSFGLRDDPMTTAAKPANTFRVVCLGDSFTLGYTVERRYDLFVDQLEGWWTSENRRVDVINAGTEGYSTDQEVVWLMENGEAFQPDLVLLFPYENDIYWNGQPKYQRFEKPLFDAEGQLVSGKLQEPPKKTFWQNLALLRFLATFKGAGSREHMFQPPGAHGPILKEFAPLLREQPDFLGESIARTRGALTALKRTCDGLGAKLVIVPIPSHSAIDPSFAPRFAKVALGGLTPERWSADRPVDLFLGQARQLGVATLDVRSTLRAAQKEGADLYYHKDWHLNPDGNRAFATFLHAELDAMGVFPEAHSATKPGAIPEAETHGGSRTWPKVFAILWGLLTVLYVLTYRDEPIWQPPLKVAGLLAVIFTIAIGGGALLARIPPNLAPVILILFVLIILGFVAWKMGRRLGTILELIKAFTLRGHWYLMPLVVILLTIGSLLVVAASSPLVAPFIYTLF